MERLLLNWLLACALIVGGGVPLAAAQGAHLQAVTLQAVAVYNSPAAEGDPLASISASTRVRVLGTDPSGAWLQIESPGGEGYVQVDQVAILTPTPLAPTVRVKSETAGAPIFDAPSMAAELIGSASFGDTARLLGQNGEWAYLVTWDGLTGWSIATAWEAIEDLEPALIRLRATDAIGLFEQPNITAALAGTLGEGQLVYLTGQGDEIFAEVLTADGASGWADRRYLVPLPQTYVTAQSGSQSKPALYAVPDLSAELLTTLESGVTVPYLRRVDDFWIEVYAPGFGTVYGMASSFSPVSTTATVRTPGANVRLGPDDGLYNSIAQLDAGTEVVVVGTNEEGDWVKVLLPFEEIDYPYRGVEGWMATFLFEDATGRSDLDLSMLSVVE